jgi:hypothetical protein
MNTYSSYDRSSHWAGDDADLELVTERVRLAYEHLREREAQLEHRQPRRLGFLRRARHA